MTPTAPLPPLALIEVTPASGIALGPLTLGFYGLGFILAAAVMVLVSRSEARRKGEDPGLVTSAIVLVAVCALIGARLYHVVGEWSLYASDPIRAILPPYAGLGLYGGILGAAAGIAIFVRGRSISLSRALDIVVPGTLLAQGIARWGNFFNQELYGPPTDLPWGITIDCAHRVAAVPVHDAFPVETTGFHPLFFYESVLTHHRRPAGALHRAPLQSTGCATATSSRSGWSGTAACAISSRRSGKAGTGRSRASRPRCSWGRRSSSWAWRPRGGAIVGRLRRRPDRSRRTPTPETGPQSG